MPFVYKITNKVNNKSYVGYTKRDVVEHRIREHFSPSIYTKIDKPLYKAIRKYGRDNFDIEILFRSEDEELTLKKEIEFISEYGDYNLHEGGNVPPSRKGVKVIFTEEQKEKLRKPKPPRTEEHRRNLSESLKGNIPWNKGKKGLQQSVWKGKRDGSRTSNWKITKENEEFIIENLVLWCEQNNYITNTIKSRYYNNRWPYKDIIKIEKVENENI